MKSQLNKFQNKKIECFKRNTLLVSDLQHSKKFYKHFGKLQFILVLFEKFGS